MGKLNIDEFIKTIGIGSLSEYESIIRELQYYRFGSDFDFFYRGHSINNFRLESGLTRTRKYDIHELKSIEEKLFNEFKKVYLFNPDIVTPYNEELRNEWHVFFQAQHLGLKTRLLDWSLSWRVALWFAVEDEKYFDEDGTIWIFACLKQNQVNVDRFKEISASCHPFEIIDDYMINAPTFVEDNLDGGLAQNRIRVQNGRFWVQPLEKSLIPMEKQPEYNERLYKIVIKHEYKAKLKKELAEDESLKNEFIYNRQIPVVTLVKKINDSIL